MDGAVDGVIIPGTKVSRNHNTGTHGHAVEEADHQKNQIAGGTNGRHGVIPQEVAYAPSVKGVI